MPRIVPIGGRFVRLFRCDIDGSQDARQAGQVGQSQRCKIVGSKPAKVVMLVGCGVYWFAVPSRDKERMHFKGWVAVRHRDGEGVVDLDTEFFEAFPNDSLARRLT